MQIHQIRYFVALSESLNFTRAAEQCNVAQPSLTRAIKQLEDELGGPLFHRERANSHLTELGRLMEPHLKHVLAEIETAKGRAREAGDLQQATLTLGVMCTIGPTKLLDLFTSYRRQYPNVNLLVRDAKGQNLQEMLLSGELEVALFGLPEGIDDRLHLMPLFDESFVITFAPGHRFELLPAIRGADLKGEPYVSRAHCEFASYIRPKLTAARDGQKPVVVYRSEREDWCLAMIRAGLGYGFTPEFAIDMPDIQSRPLIDPGFTRTVNVATVRGRPYSPTVGAFVREAMNWRARNNPDQSRRTA
ncbi:MAG: LysR family transcriptional regulator [Alphaproteobacteria bacterium]|nr:LysR family transcriptional regulator [Alphaproteobacteria bacterium]